MKLFRILGALSLGLAAVGCLAFYATTTNAQPPPAQPDNRSQQTHGHSHEGCNHDHSHHQPKDETPTAVTPVPSGGPPALPKQLERSDPGNIVPRQPNRAFVDQQPSPALQVPRPNGGVTPFRSEVAPNMSRYGNRCTGSTCPLIRGQSTRPLDGRANDYGEPAIDRQYHLHGPQSTFDGLGHNRCRYDRGPQCEYESLHFHGHRGYDYADHGYLPCR